MTKRKSTASKKTSSKIAKIEEDKKIEAVDEQVIESKDEKIETLNKKLGIVKSEEDFKDWIKGSGYLVYSPSEIKSTDKIASFDLDDTLIVSKTGKKFSDSWNDWKFLYDEVTGKLKALNEEGYKLVIFSNQGGIGKGKLKEKDFKKKINAVVTKLGLKIQVFVATAYSNIYRKPNTGMLDLLVKEYNSGISLNHDESFYVGDAAGRPADWAPNKKKDFSNSDRLFALNCKFKFYTPEKYFLQQVEAPFKMPVFNPVETMQTCKELQIKYDNFQKITNDIKDILPKDSSDLVLVVMVGSPGSGKSTFCKKYLERLGLSIINRDTLKTWQKCVAETKRLFGEKKSVVIDNTNPDVATRERYISVAEECGVKQIICCIMDVSEEHSKHNEHFRQLTSAAHDNVSEMVFKMHKNKYVEPTAEEKFTEICKIVPHLEFDNDDHKNLYSKYLLDK